MPRTMPRLGLNATSEQAQETAAEALDAQAVAKETAAYQGNLAIDTAAAQSTSRRSFEAHALIPRTITDNVSPRTRSTFK